MPESPVQYQVERTPEGHFVKGQSGNPAGKPPGCRNHASRTAEILLDSEVEALTRKAMALAVDGDALALRLCLDRIIAPRRARPVHLDLPPIAEPADIAAAMAAVTAAVAGRRHHPGRGGRGGEGGRHLRSGDRGERLRQTAEGIGSRLCGRRLTLGSRGQRRRKRRAIWRMPAIARCTGRALRLLGCCASGCGPGAYRGVGVRRDGRGPSSWAFRTRPNCAGQTR